MDEMPSDTSSTSSSSPLKHKRAFDPTNRSTFKKILHGTRVEHLRTQRYFNFMGYYRTLDPEGITLIWYVALAGSGDEMRVLCPVEQFTADRWEIHKA